LNDFDSPHMEELLAYYGKNAREYHELLPGHMEPQRRNRLLDGIRDFAFQAGLLCHGLQREPAATWEFFEASVAACEEMFRLKALPEVNTPVALLEGAYLALVLGRWGDAAELAQAERYGPERYQQAGFVADEAIMGDIAAFLASLRGEDAEAARLAGMNVDRCEQRRDAFAKRAGWQSAALLGTLRRDEARFQEALAQILRAHATEARRGRLRENTRGLLCLSGLALARLGKRAGLAGTVESPYLPLRLLKE